MTTDTDPLATAAERNPAWGNAVEFRTKVPLGDLAWMHTQAFNQRSYLEDRVKALKEAERTLLGMHRERRYSARLLRRLVMATSRVVSLTEEELRSYCWFLLERCFTPEVMATHRRRYEEDFDALFADRRMIEAFRPHWVSLLEDSDGPTAMPRKDLEP